MTDRDHDRTLLDPRAVRYAGRLLGWRSIWAGLILAIYTGWGLHLVHATVQLQQATDERLAWLHHLQWAQHDLMTHNPQDPAIRDAFQRLVRVVQAAEDARGERASTTALRAGVEDLRSNLDVPGARDEARTDLVQAIHTQIRDTFDELEGLSFSHQFRWQQFQALSISAILLATLALAAMLLARHRRLLAEHLGTRLEAAVGEADGARQMAQRASQAKSLFLATVSHELRTPMTAILGTVDLLARTELSSRQSDYLTAIRSSGEGLQSLIDDVLDLSRIEAGKLELITEPFDLDELLDALAMMFANKALSKDIQIAFLAGPELPSQVQGDALRVRQVLTNLLGNALKFTQTGRITLRARRIPDQDELLYFEVVDTGPGLTTEQQARVFEPFTQADSSLTRTHGGAGMGLAICQRLVKAMGGSLGVVSDLGQGARFHFTAELPSASPPSPRVESGPVLVVGRDPDLDLIAEQLVAWQIPAHRAHDAEEAHDRLDDLALGPPGVLLLGAVQALPGHPAMLSWRALRLLPFGAESRSDEPGIARSFVGPVRPSLVRAVLDPEHDASPLPLWEPTPVASGHRVMVVDDNDMNRLVLAEMLITMSCRVTLAHGGVQALERAQEESFDLVFMDTEMPDMDGFETTERLRQAGLDSATTAIVGLSGHVTPEHRRRGLAAGMDEYLAKPIQLTTLQRTVRRWCEEREG